MASRKSERLINLTIALLATRRYLTKSEIFRSIEGYEGDPSAKERMFERDKDDLRNLGIVIDVRGVDPGFEDEPGYRIHPESYSLNLGELTGTEVALLSLAAEAWRGAALGESAHSALIKLRSLGIASDFDALPNLSPKIKISSRAFVPLTQAIGDRTTVTFKYRSAQLNDETRVLNPYGLGSRKGNWYLVGQDHDRKALRTFRLDRIVGDVETLSKPGAFETDPDFHVLSFLDSHLFEPRDIAQLRIRRGRGHALRAEAITLSSDEQFDLCELPYSDDERFVDSILWHGDDVIVLNPLTLREKVISRLRSLVETHG
ncbi:MAG TPA: WYL domain-containing protein [Candidatus Paceibacterota bacterium]|nr:WYL domain-containing protein [Candidatus Paceibacterota bacterium]